MPRSQPEIRSLRTGHLVAIYDLSFQNARLWNQLLKTLIPLAITLAFISFVLGALIHRYITKPVEHLEKVTQRIAKGEYGAKSEVTGTGELSHLGKVINQMSSELESQNEHRLKIEEELKANREEYRTLVENSQDTILRFDQQNRICYANEAASSLINTEATSQTQIAQTVAELPVSLSSFLSKSLTHVFQNGESLGQLHLWHYGQQDLVQDWRFIPEYDSDGSIQTVLAVARDITDFHKSREARDQLLAAIEQLSELVIVTDLQGTITYANSAAERMTGLPLPTLLDANLAEIAHTHGGFPFLLRLANRG